MLRGRVDATAWHASSWGRYPRSDEAPLTPLRGGELEHRDEHFAGTSSRGGSIVGGSGAPKRERRAGARRSRSWGPRRAAPHLTSTADLRPQRPPRPPDAPSRGPARHSGAAPLRGGRRRAALAGPRFDGPSPRLRAACRRTSRAAVFAGAGATSRALRRRLRPACGARFRGPRSPARPSAARRLARRRRAASGHRRRDGGIRRRLAAGEAEAAAVSSTTRIRARAAAHRLGPRLDSPPPRQPRTRSRADPSRAAPVPPACGRATAGAAAAARFAAR